MDADKLTGLLLSLSVKTLYECIIGTSGTLSFSLRRALAAREADAELASNSLRAAVDPREMW